MDLTPCLQFVYLPIFERTAGHLSDEVLRRLEQELLSIPRRGDTIKGTGGFRKIRVALSGRGKSGGARVVYYYVERQARVYFVLAYTKNVQENLTTGQQKILRALAKALDGEP